MSDGLVFDPYSATYFDDPYDLYRRMRDEAPVLHNPDIGFYALSRWDDVVAAERGTGRPTAAPTAWSWTRSPPAPCTSTSR